VALDSSISNRLAGWLWLGVALAWGARINFKYGIVPKREHLLNPADPSYGPVWHWLSPVKWTAEGIAFHRRLIRELLVFLGAWLALFLVLDALF
jgi:hypothetical protein